MYYTNIILGCFLKGVGAGVLWKDILVLAVYATALFGIGYSRFTKRPSA
jgi:ABC-2 type transport system permease protein